MTKFQVKAKTVFIAGGSKGVGKEFALQLAAKGANITILARSQSGLDIAKADILKARKSDSQTVDTIAVDLVDPKAVHDALEKIKIVPDVLFCVAGGNITQMGYLADLKPEQITSCLEINYYSAIFITQYVLKLWLKVPVNYARHLVFTASTAAFVSLPGYVTYTTAKAAVRALADTLRQELLLYGGPDKYSVHCSFPGTFTSEGFLEEQQYKPQLVKELEGVNMPNEELLKVKMSAKQVAEIVIKGLEKGEYFVVVDFEGAILLNNMRGPSPRDHPVYDFFVGLLAIPAWFFARRDFDKRIAAYGIKEEIRT